MNASELALWVYEHRVFNKMDKMFIIIMLTQTRNLRCHFHWISISWHEECVLACSWKMIAVDFEYITQFETSKFIDTFIILNDSLSSSRNFYRWLRMKSKPIYQPNYMYPKLLILLANQSKKSWTCQMIVGTLIMYAVNANCIMTKSSCRKVKSFHVLDAEH